MSGSMHWGPNCKTDVYSVVFERIFDAGCEHSIDHPIATGLVTVSSMIILREKMSALCNSGHVRFDSKNFEHLGRFGIWH